MLDQDPFHFLSKKEKEKEKKKKIQLGILMLKQGQENRDSLKIN